MKKIVLFALLALTGCQRISAERSMLEISRFPAPNWERTSSNSKAKIDSPLGNTKQVSGSIYTCKGKAQCRANEVTVAIGVMAADNSSGVSAEERLRSPEVTVAVLSQIISVSQKGKEITAVRKLGGAYPGYYYEARQLGATHAIYTASWARTKGNRIAMVTATSDSPIAARASVQRLDPDLLLR